MIDASPDPADVGVDDRDGGAVREARDGIRRVVANTGQRPQLDRISGHHRSVVLDDLHGGAMQRHCSPWVAQPLPRPQHVRA